MDLILWRHAEAEDGSNDLQRKLTARGKEQAEAIARWLRRRLPKEYRVMASEALRSQQTARMLTPTYSVQAEFNPGASPQQVLEALGWTHPGKEVLVVVGHQPWIGQVAARLLAGTEQSWSVKKGGAWWLVRRQRADNTETVLRAVVSPDLINL